MKKLLSFIVAAVLAIVTGCNVQNGFSKDWSDADLTAVTNVMQTAAIPPGLKNLNVDNRFGAVHITGTTSGTTAWRWRLTVRARTDSIAQQIANAIKFTAQLDGDQLGLVVSMPDSNDSGVLSDLMKEPHSIQSDFEITVPKSVAVQARNQFGGVAIAELAGNVEATDANGPVEIWNIDGGVHARNSFGMLSVSNTGSATLRNQNGEIRAAQIAGPLDARTSFSPLIAQDIRGSATLNNQNGTIRADSIHDSLDAATSFASLIAKGIGGPATLHNQNGQINVTTVGGSLDANTSFDSLTVQDIQGSASLKNQNGSIRASSILNSLDATTSFDSLVVRDISGPVHLWDQNGNIKASQVKGDANIETSFAELSASDIQGDANLKDQNGRVTASGITGSVEANTSFAGIDITGAGSNFLCHNQNGSIRLQITSATLTNIEARTSFGPLEVHLPAGLKPALHAHTTFADVDSDFPLLSDLSSPESLTEIANGAARISLQNQNGKITVVRD